MPASDAPDESGALRRGRELCERGAWSDAFESLSIADGETPLGPADLERLATAAYVIGRDEDYTSTLDRAHRAYLDASTASSGATCCSPRWRSASRRGVPNGVSG